MYNLRKNDFVLFNPERTPFGDEALCVGILTSDPDFTDINGEYGASFEFLTVTEYFDKKQTIPGGYVARTANVIHNFGKCSKEKVESLLYRSNLITN